jgi:3-keto-L-gulonate-6-phosphate decarboxylase|tara:strand:- start:19827 stop:20030 length:204 start_codon:yes stop_codon:yes gene_type:complete
MLELKIGTQCMTKYGLAKITGIELCIKEGDKYGTKIKKIPVDLVNRCVFDFDNKHWQYGTEIDFIPF